ncbi:MAG: hypothetical protein ACRCR2_02470 [Fusobacteriaceae bacterium]
MFSKLNTKTKALLVLILVVAIALTGTGLFMSKVRSNGKTTWKNWWTCIGEGHSLNRESEYSPIFNTCVTLRKNADGTITKVKANLDIGLEGIGN